MKIIYVFILCLMFPLISAAQGQSSNDTSEVNFRPNKNPEVVITSVPDGSINVDGKLDEDIWKTAAKVDNFTEISPRDNVKPEVETIGYITYDNDNVYFGFVCYDDMSSLRVSMTDRDDMYQDDWVGPFIDTYNDEKQAFEFYSNAYGIQGDLVWTPNYEDSSPDFIFTSETHIYKDRWTVEMKIPFKSLRFPEKNIQLWRVHILRNRQRANRERIYWSSVSRDDPNFLGQAGFIKGIKGIKGGKQLEILPYVIGNQTSYIKDPSTNLALDTNRLKGDFGFSIKYGLTSDIVADATYNPDFSQVEADNPQIDVNQPFALFFNEKRPFFLEGISTFRLPLNMVYTRAINNPIFAGKVTGRVGKFEIGYMTAYDENTPYVIPLEEKSFYLNTSLNSLANIFRVKYDLGGENSVGLLLTDREEGLDSTLAFDFKGYNRNLALDFRFNFLKQYYFGGQITAFTTRELSDSTVFEGGDRFGSENQYTSRFDGESFSGTAAYFNLSKSAENWSFYSEYNYVPSTARRNLGFLSKNDYHTGYFYTNYSFYPDSKIFQRINPDLTMGLTFNTDGIRKDQYIYPGITIDFKNGMRTWGNYIGINNESYGGIEHRNLTRWNAGVEDYSHKAITGGVFYERGKYIYRTTPSFIGYGQLINIYGDLKPLDRLTSSFSYTYQDLARSWGGEMLYAGWVISTTTRYQFNKNLFARLVVQYNSFDHGFEIDPLFSYKWNPFTVLYIGSTHTLNQFDDNTRLGEQTLHESARQVFIKFQYLWQL